MNTIGSGVVAPAFHRHRPSPVDVSFTCESRERLRRAMRRATEREEAEELCDAHRIYASTMSTVYRKRERIYKVSHPRKYVAASPNLSAYESERALEMLEHHDRHEEEVIKVVKRLASEIPLLADVHWARSVRYEDSPAVLTCMRSYEWPTLAHACRSLSRVDVRVVIAQVLFALGHMNAQGIYHNDAAARNVLVGRTSAAPIVIRGELGTFRAPAGSRPIVLIDFNRATAGRPWGGGKPLAPETHCASKFIAHLRASDSRAKTDYLDHVPEVAAVRLPLRGKKELWKLIVRILKPPST